MIGSISCKSCHSHPSERCELNLSVVKFSLRLNYTLTDLMEVIMFKKEEIKKDFKKYNKSLKYEEILVKIKTDQSNVDTDFENLTKIVTKQGEE